MPAFLSEQFHLVGRSVSIVTAAINVPAGDGRMM